MKLNGIGAEMGKPNWYVRNVAKRKHCLLTMISPRKTIIRRINMKPEEALKKLRYPELPDGLVMVDLETRQKAIKALEKQIPKKVDNLCEIYMDFGIGKKIKVGAYGNCPNCNYNIDIVGKYCTRCGQKLDWSEENDI